LMKKHKYNRLLSYQWLYDMRKLPVSEYWNTLLQTIEEMKS